MTAEEEEYILAHISPEPARLNEIYRNTYLRHLYPRMCSGHLQGRILAMLTAMICPKRIIELGAFTGYSTLCFAEGMPADAHIDTVEIDDEIADELTATFAATPWADRIHLHIADALDALRTLPGPWDLAFIDANKRHYMEYLDLLIPKLSPGAFVLADNTLWSDKILTDSHDPQTEAIRRFNNAVATHPLFDTVILPIRDGMTILRLK